MRAYAAILSCTLLYACTATETGNPVAEQQLALTARSSDEVVQLGEPEPDTAALSVTEAWVVLGDMRFISSAQCDRGGDDSRVDVPGPTIVELVNEPRAVALALERTTYCRVRIPLERADDDASGIPAELRDHAVLLRGTRADGTPFLLRSRQMREAEVRSRGEPFSIGTAERELILSFDVGRWLEGVALDELDAGADGLIVIDERDNRDQLERFEENVERALELFRDRDHDGRLSDEEAVEALATGG